MHRALNLETRNPIYNRDPHYQGMCPILKNKTIYFAKKFVKDTHRLGSLYSPCELTNCKLELTCGSNMVDGGNAITNSAHKLQCNYSTSKRTTSYNNNV